MTHADDTQIGIDLAKRPTDHAVNADHNRRHRCGLSPQLTPILFRLHRAYIFLVEFGPKPWLFIQYDVPRFDQGFVFEQNLLHALVAKSVILQGQEVGDTGAGVGIGYRELYGE